MPLVFCGDANHEGIFGLASGYGLMELVDDDARCERETSESFLELTSDLKEIGRSLCCSVVPATRDHVVVH